MFEEIFGNWNIELAIFVRIVVAAFCGMIIGFERKRRKKEAGIRTHTIVSGGAALFTALSMFAFEGDTARVAAQIVTGIGFLGAGMIIVRRESLYGLTTAAGIWMTAGLGMAVGAGYYIAGILATIFLLLLLLVFGYFRVFQSRRFMTITIEYQPELIAPEELLKLFRVKFICRSKVAGEQGKRTMTQTVQVYDDLQGSDLVQLAANTPGILSIDALED